MNREVPGRQMSDGLFLAVAHPTRRAIIDFLVDRQEAGAGELKVLTGLSAPALSQHLAVLKDAGLVVDTRLGRTVSYRLTPEPLLEVIRWMLDFRTRWEARLDALGAYLDSQHEEKDR